MDGLNVKSINGLSQIYSNSIIEDISKGDIQKQINDILLDGTSDLSRIISLENSRTTDELNISNNSTNISHLQDDVHVLELKTEVLEGEQIATDSSVAGIEAQLVTVNVTISTLEGDVAAIEENVLTLQNKTQGISSTNTTSLKTTFNNKICMTNGVSDKIVLDGVGIGTYFGNAVEFNNNINQTSGNLTTTNILGLNNDVLNIGATQTNGTININASSINLNGVNITINGITCAINALTTDNNFFAQW